MGVLTAAHGVRGAMRLRPETDFPERLSGRRVWLAAPVPRWVAVESAQPDGRGFLIVRLSGVDDRDAAEAVCGSELQVPVADLPALPEGEYYHYQIVGLRVRDPVGCDLGRVVGIERTGANDVYTVERDDGRRWYLPAIRDAISRIDVARGEIAVLPLRGLIEEFDDAD